MRLFVLTLALAGALAAAGCSRAAEEDKAFGDKVRAYLLAHPEVIKEAADKYNANLETAKADEARAAIGKNRAALERDPRDFVANPGGKVTITEFYDYNCAHCKNVAPKVIDFIARHPDVRVVFKELPIFGAASEHAAFAALAVKRSGGDYLRVHAEMMGARPLDAAAIDRILRAHKVDPAILDQPAAAKEAASHLTEIQQLAGHVGVEGTPAFIIGDTLIPGEDMEAVEAAVTEALKGKG